VIRSSVVPLQGKRTSVEAILKKLILVNFKKLGVETEEPVKVLLFLFLFLLVGGDKIIQVLDLLRELQELGGRESKLLTYELINLLYHLSYFQRKGLETLSCIGEKIFDIFSINLAMI
jgi:hypothetical protein